MSERKVRWYADKWTLGGVTTVDALGSDEPNDVGGWTRRETQILSCGCPLDVQTHRRVDGVETPIPMKPGALEQFITAHVAGCTKAAAKA